MPKMKTNRAAAKRFKPTGKGRFKRGKANHSHNFENKNMKRKRRLRTVPLVHESDEPRVRRMIPYASAKN